VKDGRFRRCWTCRFYDPFSGMCGRKAQITLESKGVDVAPVWSYGNQVKWRYIFGFTSKIPQEQRHRFSTCSHWEPDPFNPRVRKGR